MKRDVIVEIPNDGRWDFVHRFRNFGEDVFRALRDSCSVDIHEVDASTTQFSVRQIPEEKTSQVCTKRKRRTGGDVDENNNFTFLVSVVDSFYQLGIPMAEIARHVGVCGSAVVKAIQKMESADQDS